MKQLKVTCKCSKTKHDFITTEIYENGRFMGDLYKCNHCGKEHLCPQGVAVKAASCTHSNEFYINCNPA